MPRFGATAARIAITPLPFVVGHLVAACQSSDSPTPDPTVALASRYAYDQAVLDDHPIAYLPLKSPTQGSEKDETGNGRSGTYPGNQGTASIVTMPNQDFAVSFNGANQFVEIQDHDKLSIATTGMFTVEAWIRPDTLEFSNQEGSLRMYSYTNTETPPRPNRISGYAFNLAGGLGSGSYFQNTVVLGDWIQVAVVYNTVDVSATYPTGYVQIYKNGVLRDTTAMDQYSIVPANGTAPLRIGTRNSTSFFEGAIGKVALYDYPLSAARILEHHRIMTIP